MSERQSLLCSNECLDESERIGNKSSKTKTLEEVNENNIIDKQSINSLIQSFDEECNQNIGTNGEKVIDSKSCDNNLTQSKFESKSIEKSIHKEKRSEIELNVSEDNESITAFDTDIDSSQTEIDSHFDDKKKRNKTVNKSNCLSNKFKCDFIGCEKIYKRKHSLKDHKLSDGNANFKCDFIDCNYKTYNKKYLREHQMRHSEEKRFNFDECKASFKFKRNLNKNKGHNSIGVESVLKCDSITGSCDQNVKNESQFECNENGCQMKFKFRSELNEHKKRKHSKSTQIFKCDSIGCSFTTNNWANLKNHQKIDDLQWFHFVVTLIVNAHKQPIKAYLRQRLRITLKTSP